MKAFTETHRLDPDALIRNLRRRGTPDRVYFMELFQDVEIENEVDKTFQVTKDLDPADPFFPQKRAIAMQRFLGYEYVPIGLLALERQVNRFAADPTQGSQNRGTRRWLEEGKADISTFEEFEKYPWPDGKTWDTRALEWYEKNLPDDMCLVGRGGHFCEYLCWLMGYETLCYALYEQPDLVQAIADRVLALETAAAEVLLKSPRVKIWWASDDLGFKTGLMFSPDQMRRYVLSGHRKLAAMAHAKGIPYLLHACGKRTDILEDLIEDVKLDAIHSFEDTIERITDAKREYGSRMSLIGGIDVDFLCRSDETAIRRRVRETIDVCQPGGGFCLGTGNSVANYIPMKNYLVMLDEGRKYRNN